MGVRLRTPKRAQSMVEFALVFTLFLVLLLGVIEFGHLLFVYTATTSAAAEAARYAAATGTNERGVPYYQDCAGIQQAALRLGAMAGLRPEDVVVEYDNGPGTAVYARCPTPPTRVDGGDRVIVRVRATYRPWVPLFPQWALPIEAQVSRTILGQVNVVP